MSKNLKFYCPFCGISVDELTKMIPDVMLKYKLSVPVIHCPCGYHDKQATSKSRVIGVGYDEIKEVFGSDIMDWMWNEIAFADVSKKVKFVYLYSTWGSGRNEFRIFVDYVYILRKELGQR